LTVILTALAGPAGSAGLGLGLGRWAEATTGGMAVLGALVLGIWLGGPLLALLVFTLCLNTLLRPLAIRRWMALLLMLAAVIVQATVALIGLRFVGGSASPEVGLALLLIPAVGVLAGGAFVAITASRRRITAEPAD
jgi:hypothetical protein